MLVFSITDFTPQRRYCDSFRLVLGHPPFVTPQLAGVLFTIGNCRNSELNAWAVRYSLLIVRTSLHRGEGSAELLVFIGNLSLSLFTRFNNLESLLTIK
jgi:hypothetical protein